MDSLAHRYPEFGQGDTTKADIPMAEDALEDIQLASFDAGYQAGWDDAAKAQISGSDRAAIDVAQNLQDMSFTHHEAYLKLSAAMKPLFVQIVEKLLPQAARQLVGMHIVDQLTKLMDAHAQNAVEIAVSPESAKELQELLEGTARVPFTLRAEPTLSSGQAYLRATNQESEIDLDAVLTGISEAVEAFYDQTKTERADD